MAIAFAGSATFYTGFSNVAVANVTLPNISNGSLWVVHFVIIGSGCTECTDGTPTIEAGWTKLVGPSTAGGFLGSGYVFYKIREAGDNTTFTVTFPVGFPKQCCANSVGYSGTATTDIFDTDSHRDPFDESTSTSPISFALTTTTTNTMILRLMTADDGDGSTLPISFPGGVTNRGSQDISDLGGGNGGHIRFGEDGLQASAGSTGTATWSIGANEGWATNTIAIRDAANDIAPVSNTLTLDYDITSTVGNNLTLDYDILSAVNNNLTLDYDVFNLVDNNLTLLYTMGGVVSNNITLDYDIFNLVDNNLTLLYDMISRVNNSITLDYDIINQVNNNVTLNYDIINLVNNNVILKYGNFESISNSITLDYDIIGRVSNSITLNYDILNFVDNNVTLNYDILNFVDNNLTLDYNILNFVDNNLTLDYDIINLVNNSITNRWKIINFGCTNNNLFDRQFFGDLQQFDTTLCVDITINEPSVISDDVSRLAILLISILDGAVSIVDTIDARVAIPSKVFFDSKIKELLDFASRIKESLNFISRIKEDEDVSI